MYRFAVVFMLFLDLLSFEVDFSFTECARFCSAVQHVLLPLSSYVLCIHLINLILTFLLVLCFADIHTIHIFLFIFFFLFLF